MAQAVKTMLKQVWKNPMARVVAVVLLLLLSYGGYRIYKELTMPPPLVYLIPEDYIGPVFVLFGQSDGVDVKPDPLGNAVWVPENGIVKIREKDSSKLLQPFVDNNRPEYMIAVSKSGERRIMGLFGHIPHRVGDSENLRWIPYMDESFKMHKFHYDLDVRKGHDFLPENLRRKRAVFNHDACRHLDFSPRHDDIADGTISMDEAGVPHCGQFIIISPDEMDTAPEWIWKESQTVYDSVQELVDEANERLKKKKAYYGLP